MGSTMSLALTYCCFTAAGSLCTTCFGSTAEGTTGRRRSVLLLAMAIAFALWFQYQVGPSIVQEEGWVWKTYRAIPGTGKLVFHAWKDEKCSKYEGDLLSQCAGNAGVYRPMFVAAIFFGVQAFSTKMVPHLNREAWPAKYMIYLFALFFTMFIPNYPLFSGFFLWVARFGAAVFVVLQQVILIDVAYNWNDDWVEKSNECDRTSYGSGGKWLQAILATCVFLFSASIVGISLLYRLFDDCPENTWIITLTLLGIIGMTILQLSGTEGSLLTSSVISVYATYLAYGMVSKNPKGTCNPMLGYDDIWGIVVGLALTSVSLVWVGWAWSAERRLTVGAVQSTKAMSSLPPHNSDSINLDVPFLDPEGQQPTGVVMQQSTSTGMEGSDVWKLNVVMALICCWVAMTLTGWGTIEELNDAHNAANPTVGRANMAIIGISQWLAIGLYVWTLAAPRLFPDRDFS